MKKFNTVKKTRLEVFLQNAWHEDMPAPTDFIENYKKSCERRNVDPNESVEMTYEVFKCSICGEEIDDSFSNNAQPINNGRCCDLCNYTVVLPARMDRMRRGLGPY